MSVVELLELRRQSQLLLLLLFGHRVDAARSGRRRRRRARCQPRRGRERPVRPAVGRGRRRHRVGHVEPVVGVGH